MKILSNLFGNNTKINANAIAVKKTDNTADTLDNCVIVDSGSNDNGSWIKWADGTMICHKFLAEYSSASLWANGIYYHDISNGNWPQEFKLILNCQVTNTTNQWWCCIDGVSEASAGTTRLIRADSNSQEYNIHLLAIGKWK